MIDPSSVAEKWTGLVEHIRARGRSDVRVVAVTKTFGVDAIRAVMAAGCRDIGENYAQELVGKVGRLGSTERPRIHFIGRLQSRKVRSLAAVVDLWQTIDRESLVDEVARRAPGAHILVQVNATGEADKGGCILDAVEPLVDRARQAGLVVEGLMTVGPTDGDPLRTRRAFATTAACAARIGLGELSMGMSGDLDIALDEGATIVRIGSAIFGERPPAT